MAQDPGNIWWHMAACVYRKYTTVGRTCAKHTEKKSKIIGCITAGDPRDYRLLPIHPVYCPTLETFKGADADRKKGQR